MDIVLHRINTIKELKNIPAHFGCEIDIRSFKSNLILNHEPYKTGDLLENYLNNYKHGLLILNIKETGIENDVLKLVRNHNIKNYFLLDVEFPYLYKATRLGEKNIAIRFSEEEPIEFVKLYKNKVDWVWIDTLTKLPLTKNIIKELTGFKTCLVCPERWGRPEDIIIYRKYMKKNNFILNAIMTNLKYINLWQQPI